MEMLRCNTRRSFPVGSLASTLGYFRATPPCETYVSALPIQQRSHRQRAVCLEAKLDRESYYELDRLEFGLLPHDGRRSHRRLPIAASSRYQSLPAPQNLESDDDSDSCFC